MLGHWEKWLRRRPSWRSSAAHKLLLSKFLLAERLEKFTGSTLWDDVLGEPVKDALERLITEEILEQAPLAAALEVHMSLATMRQRLKKIGISDVGDAHTLAERLARSAAARPLEAELAPYRYYRCSHTARNVVIPYLKEQALQRKAAQEKMLLLLRKDDVAAAYAVLQAFEGAQVFPRRAVLWDEARARADIKKVSLLLEHSPVILRRMPRAALAELRVALAMGYLWDEPFATWLPEGFRTSIHLSAENASRMLWAYGNHLQSMQLYKGDGVHRVQVICPPEAQVCEVCSADDGIELVLAEVPELPHSDCFCANGCGCVTVAIL